MSNALANIENHRNKLDEIRIQLAGNPRLVVAGETHEYNSSSTWTHRVDIIVAPLKPTFDLAELNDFMTDLVDMPVTNSQNAKPDTSMGPGGIHLGLLTFDELLGQAEREITETVTALDAETLKKAGIVIGLTKSTETRELKRRIFVRPYPDPVSAKVLHTYEQGLLDRQVKYNDVLNNLRLSITGKQVEELKRGQSAGRRVSGFLGA